MPETPEQFWERARAGVQTPPVEEWDSWPFRGAITQRELEPPVDDEPPRHGVGCVDCREGSEHCRIWFMGRTARMMQFRSSFAAVWDDVLPPTPEDVWRANLELVRGALDGEAAGA